MNKKFTFEESTCESFCRFCDGVIKKGEKKVSFYSHRNQGMYIHLHPQCIRELNDSIYGFVVISRNPDGEIIAVTRQNEDYEVLSIIGEPHDKRRT